MDANEVHFENEEVIFADEGEEFIPELPNDEIENEVEFSVVEEDEYC